MTKYADDYVGPDRWASNTKRPGQLYPSPDDKVKQMVRDKVRVRLNPNLDENTAPPTGNGKP